MLVPHCFNAHRPAQGLLATVAEKPHRFTPAEYGGLLAASVPERTPATPEQRQQLQRVLAEAGVAPSGAGGGASKGGKGGKALAALVKAVGGGAMGRREGRTESERQ